MAAYNLRWPYGSPNKPVPLKLFVHEDWLQRPQYNLEMASREEMRMGEFKVKVFNPERLFCEKILFQCERRGALKEATDVKNLSILFKLVLPRRVELDFDGNQSLTDALQYLVEKEPELAEQIKRKVKCAAVFHNWLNPYQIGRAGTLGDLVDDM